MSAGSWAVGEAAELHVAPQGRFTRWGVERIVALRIAHPADAHAAVDRLEREIERERRFAVLVEGPADVAHLDRMLAQAPAARQRLRRIRPALGTWCAGVAHVVVDVHDVVWPAEVLWGCRATAAGHRDGAEAWLRARLAA